MKLLRQIAIQFGVTFVALALLFTLGAPALQHFEGHTAVQKVIYTLGFAGEAYAITPDYEVDGNADDVQVQQALNALPVTGGKLVLYAGNWHFNATVSRAINNVTIEGDGKGTYAVNNGATALFSAGAQTGWLFKEIRTDAGGITAASDTLFVHCYIGTSPRDSTVMTGTTMPTTATAVVGQQFYQSTTGRNYLYSYNGSIWLPMESFGIARVYVDSTDGTDDQNHGTGIDAAAYKTIQYAWNQIPATYNDNVEIYVDNETYNESLIFDGKHGNHTSTIFVYGTLSQQATASQDSSVQGTGATQGSITDAGAFGAYDNMLLYSSNNAEYRIIDSDNVNTATIVGTWSSAPAGAYTVYNWGTKVTGSSSLLVRNGQHVQIYDIWFDGSVNDTLANSGASSWFYRCKFAGVSSVEVQSTGQFQMCLFNVHDGSWTIGASGFAEMYQSKVFYTNTVARYAFIVRTSSNLYIDGGCVFDGISNTYGDVAVYADMSSSVFFDDMWFPASGYPRIRNWTTGLTALSGASIVGTTNNQYSGNSNNEVPTAGSYGYID